MNPTDLSPKVNLYETSSISKVRVPGLEAEDELNSITTLEELAKPYGYKESKNFSALNALSRTLNFTNAVVAGTVRGLLSDEGIISSAKKAVRLNQSWSDIYKDLGWQAKTKTEKFARGSIGFASDILFDPLTYLTFGTSAAFKVGGKAIAKGASAKAVKGLEEEVFTSTFQKLSKEMTDESTARILARQEASDIASKVVNEAVSEKGLSKEMFDDVLRRVGNTQNIDYIQHAGSELLSRGGIRWFGRMLVTSDRLAQTPIGKAAKALGETEIAVALKNTFGRLFIYAFKENPVIRKTFDMLDTMKKRVVVETADMLRKTLDNYSHQDTYDVVMSAFGKKRTLVEKEKDILAQIKKDYLDRFPGSKFPESFEQINEFTAKQTAKLNEQIENLSKGISDGKIESALKQIEDIRAELSSVLPRGGKKKVELLDEASDEFTQGVRYALDLKQLKLAERLTNLKSLLEKARAGKVDGKIGGATEKVISKTLSPEEKIGVLLKQIKQVQDEMVEKTNFLTKAQTARRQAKAQLAMETLNKTIDGVAFNPKAQELADELFNKPDSLISKLAKESGLPPEDAIKFYLTETLENQTLVKGFATGRNLKPNLAFQKHYEGLSDYAKQLKPKDAKDAILRSFTQVKIAKLKSQAVESTIKNLGLPFESMTAKKASELGYELFEQQGVDGMIKGWLPKELVPEIKNHLIPQKSVVADLAKWTGFDYITGLTKSYLTVLFPGFHFRNLTGNEWNSFLQFSTDTFNPAIVGDAFNITFKKNLDKEFIDKFGRRISLGEIRKLVEKNTNLIDQLGSGAFSRQELLLSTAEEMTKRNMWNPFSSDNLLLKGGKQVGNAVENFSKLKAILIGLKRGDSIDDAIKSAESALFNYSKLTPFEREVMRRLIPFYSFARFNAEFQVRMLMENPGRVSAQFKAIRGLGNMVAPEDSADPDTGIPHWLLDSFQIRNGYNQFGEMKVMTGFGIPTEEFMNKFSGNKGIIWNAVQNMLTMANPLVKLPLERATGRDFFRDRPIAEISNANGLKWLLDSMPKPVEKELKEFLQFNEVTVPQYINGEKAGTKVKYTANPFRLHFLRNLPTSRVTSTIGAYSDPEASNLESWIHFFTGFRNWSFNAEETKRMQDFEKRKELQSFLYRVGVMGTKEIPFLKAE